MWKFFKKDFLGKKIRSLFQKKVDEEAIENLEKLFFEADLSSSIVEKLIEKVRQLYRKNSNSSADQILEEIQKELLTELNKNIQPVALAHPHVIFIVGVNGNGKTTTVAKLAAFYKKQGKKVVLAAADTFRAAAVEQLEIWAERIGCDIVRGKQKGDAASVAFDALEAAKSRGHEVVIIDSAGRLHTKLPLMMELEKIYRVIKKVVPQAPHETLLVLDANTGKSGIDQGKIFHKHTPLTGIVLTKMDGTAKGGVAITLQQELKVPIRFMGTGEGLEDIEVFDPKQFVESLLE